MTSKADDFQEQALRSYTILRLLDPRPQPDAEPGWGGALIVSIGLGPLGASVALAANIAGAVSLAIDDRPEMCRAALRSGACDFAVNSVDEALRVIKNEIRKHQPLSVALETQPAQALSELTERGVRPQLFVDLAESGQAGIHQATNIVQAQGTLVVSFDRAIAVPPGTVDGSGLLADHIAAQHLDLCSFVFPAAAMMRTFDARAAELLTGDAIRHRWTLAASRHFLRERPPHRVLLLMAGERTQLEREFPTT